MSTDVAASAARSESVLVENVAEKMCGRCRTVKTRDCFAAARQRPDGLHGYCKDCNREYQRELHARNPEAARERGRRRYLKHKEKIKERMRSPEARARERTRAALNRTGSVKYVRLMERYRSGDVAAARVIEKKKASALRRRAATTARRYGLTLEQHAVLFQAQGSRCACCLTERPLGKFGWHIDHDHATGTVRGILCGTCNTRIGSLGDTVSRMAERVSMYRAYLLGTDDRMTVIYGPRSTRRTQFVAPFVATFEGDRAR